MSRRFRAAALAAMLSVGGSGLAIWAHFGVHNTQLKVTAIEAFASTGTASLFIDNQYRDNHSWTFSGCSAESPCWAAVHVATGPSRLFVKFEDEATDDWECAAVVSNYSMSVSSNSTNGADGSWTTATDSTSGSPVNVAVTGNGYKSRGHVLDFTGQSWVKLTITSSVTAVLDELLIWDVSAGAAPNYVDDGWAFHGDSNTDRIARHGCAGCVLAVGEDFEARVTAGDSARHPTQLFLGTAGAGVDYGASTIAEYMGIYPFVRNWVLMFGTNDLCIRTGTQYAGYAQTWIDAVVAAGHVPHLAKPLWSNGDRPCPERHAEYNSAIDTLCTTNGISAVDLYTPTYNHSEYFSGDVHVSQAGNVLVHQLLANYALAH